MPATLGASSLSIQRESRQPHIPRLAYRNPSLEPLSPSQRSFITVGTESSAATTSTTPSSPPPSTFSHSPRSSFFPTENLSSSSYHGLTERSDPLASSLLSPRPTPKKKSSIFKFFTVKEPSTQAFEDYQEQMRKRGITQTGRANTVGLPGVSSAKLPPTVPKVNSKWDGVPAALKERGKGMEGGHRLSTSSSANRPVYTSRSTGSTMTTSTTSSTGSDIRTNGRLRLDDSSGNLSDLYGWEAGPPPSSNSAKDIALEVKKSQASDRTLGDQSSFFPTQPPPIPSTYRDHLNSTPPPLDSPSIRSSPAFTAAEPFTPITPNIPSFDLLLSSSRPNQNAEEVIATSTIETKSQSANEHVLLASSGINILGPPASARRRPKPAPLQAGEAGQSRSLPDLSSESTPPQPDSVLKKHAFIPPSPNWPLRPPIPAEFELQRRNSARERLGLGMTLKNSSTPSWHEGMIMVEDSHLANAGNSLTSTPGGTLKLRRMPRMSLFNKAS